MRGALFGMAQTACGGMTMEYRRSSLDDFKRWGYNPIHMIGDYYLLRKYPKNATLRRSPYSLAKIKKEGLKKCKH